MVSIERWFLEGGLYGGGFLEVVVVSWRWYL